MTSIIIPLAGVLLGGSLSIGAQRLAQRSTEALDARRRRSDLDEARRTETRAALERFLTTAQDAERAAIDRHFDQGGSDWNARASAAIDQVWVAQKVLYLVSPEKVHDEALKYADAVDDLLWRLPADSDPWKYLIEPRQKLLDAARSALE